MLSQPPLFSFVRDTGSGVAILVKLAPRSSSNRVIGEHAGRLKIAVTAPPVDGKANELLVEFLAKLLNVAKRSVVITRGETSREIEVGIAGVSFYKIYSTLNGALK